VEFQLAADAFGMECRNFLRAGLVFYRGGPHGAVVLPCNRNVVWQPPPVKRPDQDGSWRNQPEYINLIAFKMPEQPYGLCRAHDGAEKQKTAGLSVRGFAFSVLLWGLD